MSVKLSRSQIVDDFDNTVKAITSGIGPISVDENSDVVEVILQCTNEPAQRDNRASLCVGHSVFEGFLRRRGTITVIPEVLDSSECAQARWIRRLE